MSFKNYPRNEGWIRNTMTLVKKEPVSEEFAKKLCVLGADLSGFEFGPVSQRGATVTVFYRENNWQERCKK